MTNAYHKFVDITHYRHIYGFMSGYKFVLQSNCRRLFSNDLDKQLCGPDTSISFAVDSCTSRSRISWLVLLLPSIELSSLKFMLFRFIIISYFIGSCIQTGLTECCLFECQALDGPCYCDEICLDAFDCCRDIYQLDVCVNCEFIYYSTHH